MRAGHREGFGVPAGSEGTPSAREIEDREVGEEGLRKKAGLRISSTLKCGLEHPVLSFLPEIKQIFLTGEESPGDSQNRLSLFKTGVRGEGPHSPACCISTLPGKVRQAVGPGVQPQDRLCPDLYRGLRSPSNKVRAVCKDSRQHWLLKRHSQTCVK